MNLREVHFYQCSFFTDSVFGPHPTAENTNSVNSNSPSSPSKTGLESRTETKSTSSPAPSSAFSPPPSNPPSVTQLSFSSVSFESNVNIDNFFASIHSNLPRINSISLSFCAYRSSTPSPSTFQLFKCSKSSIRLWGLSLIGKEECRIFNDLRRVDSGFFEGFFYLTIGYIDEPDPLDPTGEHLLLDISKWRLESKTMVRTSFWIHRLTLDSVAKIRRCLEASFSERPTKKRSKTEVEVNTSSAEKEKECGREEKEDEDSEEEDSYYCRFWSTSTIQLLVDVSTKNDIVGWNLYQQLKDWCHSEYGRHISIDWIGIPSYLNSPS
ncbi:hypothetical protein C8Q75DRAFT_139388 [Abortiporus biennis]|nr:hypothetical protein C8Q75DRAFT_139388 [Abortiporus biennis]